MHTAVSEGNQQLHNLGAKPFPSEPWHNSFRELLATAVSLGEPVQIEVKSIPNFNADTLINEALQDSVTNTCSQAVQPHPKDIYEAVLPFILNRLQQPKDAKSLAECLDVKLYAGLVK